MAYIYAPVYTYTRFIGFYCSSVSWCVKEQIDVRTWRETILQIYSYWPIRIFN